jgi:hypothetical protein
LKSLSSPIGNTALFKFAVVAQQHINKHQAIIHRRSTNAVNAQKLQHGVFLKLEMQCGIVSENLLLLVIYIDAMMKNGLRKIIAKEKAMVID